MTIRYTTYEAAKANSAIVYSVASAGLSHEEIIVALVNEVEAMTRQMIALEEIAPKAVRKKDGTVFVWHCPNELIPVEDIA